MSKNLRSLTTEIKCPRHDRRKEKQAFRRAGKKARRTLAGRVAAAVSGSFLRGRGGKAVRTGGAVPERSLAKDGHLRLFRQQKERLEVRIERAAWFERHVPKPPAAGVNRTPFKAAKKNTAGIRMLRKHKRAPSVSAPSVSVYRPKA